ncbi:MAG TPA: hypothetical protein GX692_08775, partial [Acholeplasmataceae bacterium]|nr:hypothetical protein [Acholeplasmataceae bacterium]
EIPTNEWVLVGFDVTEAGVGFVVEGLYVNGEMHMDSFTVYLDDLVMLHESVFESNE